MTEHAPVGSGRIADYLVAVEAGLDLPSEVHGEVVDELAGHLADSTEALVQEGLDRDAAEREALARLGRPEPLAADLTRAQQTRRRLLAGIGGGIYAAGGRWITALILGWAGLLALLLPSGMIIAVLGRAMGIDLALQTGDQSVNTVLVALADCLAAVLSARALVRVSAERSRRPMRQLRVWWALIGGLGLGLWSIFGLVMPQGPVAAAVEAAIPVAFVLGALVRIERPGPHLPVRLVAVALLVALLPVLALGTIGGGMISGGSSELVKQPDLHWDLVGLRASLQTDGGGWWGTSDGGIQTDASSAAAIGAAGFHDLRFEAWSCPIGDHAYPVLDPAHPHPFAVAPAVREADRYLGTFHLDRYRDVNGWTLFFTGVGSDGRRYLLGGGGGGQSTFRGSLWDWLTAPSVVEAAA